jgi:hypothetical protein
MAVGGNLSNRRKKQTTRLLNSEGRAQESEMGLVVVMMMMVTMAMMAAAVVIVIIVAIIVVIITIAAAAARAVDCFQFLLIKIDCYVFLRGRIVLVSESEKTHDCAPFLFAFLTALEVNFSFPMRDVFHFSRWS